MKNAFRLATLAAVALIALAAGTAIATQGVSPGAHDRLAQVNNSCPTFSWQGVPEAAQYEIVAYSLHTDEDPAEAQLAAETEVLYTRVPSGATSWTPSADQCFAPGGRYVWFVRAVTELIDDQVIEAGEWSAGRYFAVPAAPSEEEMRRAVEVLKRWEAANGGGSLMLSSAAVPASAAAAAADVDADPDAVAAPVSGAGAGAGGGAGANRRKSVPTAPAAIRGEHPETSGEAYGVVGTSASEDGAGVAASNMAGGPDLVLDGLTHGETDTALSEAGIDRRSVNSEVFEVKNSGPGGMRLSVEGEIAATALDCPNCVDSATIADGSIIDNDLADDAVTEEKIEPGAVGTAKLQNNSVNSEKIADETVASVDLADGAVTRYKIAGGAVSSTSLAAGSVHEVAIATGAVTTDKIADRAVTTETINTGAVTTVRLGTSAVTTDKIADGTITGTDVAAAAIGSAHIVGGAVTGAHIDPTSWVYVSKSQLYEREESVSLVGIGDQSVTANCDDSNDLPIAASCRVQSAALRLYGENAVDWTSAVNPAGWTCHFYNDIGGTYLGTVKILCISVP